MNVAGYANWLMTHMSNAKWASGRKFINCRCPECGDSANPSSAHMYIYIPWNNTDVSWYYCHKCNSSSIINYKKLLEWDIYDEELAVELDELNRAALNGPKKSKYYNRKVYNLKYTPNNITIDDQTVMKRNYVGNRIGRILTYEDLVRLKIVLNLKDLLYENNIGDKTRDENIINDLDREFIGFLSVDNAFLNMRRTCNEGRVYKSIDKRYVNYKIFDKQDTSQRFYTIPTEINIEVKERIPLHIAEGPFDILSVFLNLRNADKNAIYTCVAGSNYISVIMFFLAELMIPNLELHFYPDNDKLGTNERIISIIDRIPDKTIPVYIHRNTMPGEKDFGVPLTRIKESIERIR